MYPATLLLNLMCFSVLCIFKRNHESLMKLSPLFKLVVLCSCHTFSKVTKLLHLLTLKTRKTKEYHYPIIIKINTTADCRQVFSDIRVRIVS